MPNRLMKANDDCNVWGVTQNDYMRTLLGANEYLDIRLNSTNPPTVMQYTRFQYYNTSTNYTISSTVVTGNKTYPAGSTPTYLLSEAIWEDGCDRTFTWGTGNFTSSVIGGETYYLYCCGSLDTTSTSVGQGNYGATTNVPTLQINKGGYYTSTGGKALASFIVSSGSSSISNLKILVNPQKNIDLNSTYALINIYNSTYIEKFASTNYKGIKNIYHDSQYAATESLFKYSDDNIAASLLFLKARGTSSIPLSLETADMLMNIGACCFSTCSTSFQTPLTINCISESSGSTGIMPPAYFAISLSTGIGRPQRFRIGSGGQIYAYTLSGSTSAGSALKYNTSTKEIYYDTSDENLKENFRDVTSSDIDFLNTLKVWKYDRKDGRKDEIGLIAQEVNIVKPQLACKNEKGDIIAYDKIDMIPILLKKIQILEEDIKNLKKVK